MRSFATRGELTIITGFDPNHSMQRAPYLRASLINVLSALLRNSRKHKTFPTKGRPRGPLAYGGALVPFFTREFKAVMKKMMADSNGNEDSVQMRVGLRSSIWGSFLPTSSFCRSRLSYNSRECRSRWMGPSKPHSIASLCHTTCPSAPSWRFLKRTPGLSTTRWQLGQMHEHGKSKESLPTSQTID